jgi:hypothetical protein
VDCCGGGDTGGEPWSSVADPEPVRRVWRDLGLPGIIDVHTHFMPRQVMDKVWRYFDSAGPLVGRPWPITYRADEQRRVAALRDFGIVRFTSLLYPHKPDMAGWLNQWAQLFADETPDCLRTATFFPEPDAGRYVVSAIRRQRDPGRHPRLQSAHPGGPVRPHRPPARSRLGCHCGRRYPRRPTQRFRASARPIHRP